MEKNPNDETGVTKFVPKPLVKIDDLYQDIELASKMNDFNRLLNHPPKPEWIKKHPIATKEIKDARGNKMKVPIEYMPIGIIENLVTAIFLKSRTEIKNVQLIANSVQVTVRVWVLDPVTGEWDWQEGVGAAPIRTAAGKAATDFAFVQDSAVQTATPAAKSYAEKDAYEKFGKIFGRDLNRAEDNLLSYANLDKKFGDIVEIPIELKTAITEADLEGVGRMWDANPEYQGNPEFLRLLNERKEVLKKAQ